ncbi:MAG: LytR/AlgR family transcriptional regulator [Anaerosporomusa subterranea]|nr:LytR/AlgR family transcriptional regulator [Anaerosporomusa subterranea]
MSKLRALIVDDELLICDELRCVLETIQDIEVQGIAHNAQDAARIAAAKPVDIVFLDIHMPGMSGLELAKRLSSAPRPPLIVFVTAYSDFAVGAFAVDAVDYILKPFDENDIARVLKKVRVWQQVRCQSQSPRIYSTVRKLCVEAGDRLEVIDVSRIQVIQADDRQVFLRTVEGQTFGVRRRLNELEAMLDSKDFYRCHRNYIVNVNQIRQIANWFNRGYLLIMKDPPSEIPVGRVYASKLKEYLPV